MTRRAKSRVSKQKYLTITNHGRAIARRNLATPRERQLFDELKMSHGVLDYSRLSLGDKAIARQLARYSPKIVMLV